MIALGTAKRGVEGFVYRESGWLNECLQYVKINLRNCDGEIKKERNGNDVQVQSMALEEIKSFFSYYKRCK